ncbi:GNAT family N-acetyltransferase [Streptomyces sp. TRM43335]|uniref:GNAT family N-acetyltransferase n=1 Tax=Streptomyces taklimakanensis TaxID=2569853 RepID=A0A6G2BI49_9ACTN|nr:GNAT family N-acetyltransferase [Streptomyces taklimakanensis]MTE21967.1 GNAT family N-acetyltransferase [Streptomyces taklimakanensis]
MNAPNTAGARTSARRAPAPAPTPAAPGEPETRFRVAREEDVPALVALVESAYRGESSRAGWTTEADLLDGQRTDPEGVADVIRAPDSVLMVAERDGEPVACCQLERRTGDAGEPVAYFGMFAVRPVLQGGGLGRTVLAEAERRARAEWGAREMHMTVITAREDLIAWYERRGYVRTGERSPFPYGDERFGVPRRPDLEFELLVKPLDR